MKKGYKIRLEAGSGLMNFINKNSGNRRPLAANIDDERTLNESEVAAMQALNDQGVLPDRAKTLVQTYGPERVLDIVDYQSSQIKGKSSRVQNPAGLIIFSLENNLPIPVSFVTSRLRKEVQNKAKAADELRQRDAELRISYAESKDARLEEEFAKRFTSSELRAKVQEIILEHGKSDEIFKRVTLEQRQQIALQLIKKEIRDEIGFPSLEEWVLGQTQFSLF
jgi:DNA-binding helix-hairpin-helix protein with protein kinase domain